MPPFTVRGRISQPLHNATNRLRFTAMIDGHRARRNRYCDQGDHKCRKFSRGRVLKRGNELTSIGSWMVSAALPPRQHFGTVQFVPAIPLEQVLDRSSRIVHPDQGRRPRPGVDAQVPPLRPPSVARRSARGLGTDLAPSRSCPRNLSNSVLPIQFGRRCDAPVGMLVRRSARSGLGCQRLPVVQDSHSGGRPSSNATTRQPCFA